jgi:shikimate dehydrogenase
LQPLLGERPACLVIANRTASKARDLAELADTPLVTGGGLDELGGQRFDLIINATAAGLNAQVPAIPDDCLADGGWTYDMLYGQGPTAFVDWGRAHAAARALDGLGMLVEQAAESFRLWRGVQPDTGSVIESLRVGG